MPINLTKTVASLFGASRYRPKGLRFGVEVEMEGAGLPDAEDLIPGWSFHRDGSLRGESGEYVFDSPKTLTESRKLIEDLFAHFRNIGSVLKPSYRTSTHVHVNVSDLTWGKVANIITIWAMVEKAALAWCAPRRDGNLFCIPFYVSPQPISDFIEFTVTGLCDFKENRLKYSSLNLYTLRKFGTLEFRTLEGLSNPGKLFKWLNFLEALYTEALSFKNPTHILTTYSEEGRPAFIRRILSQIYSSDENGDGWSWDSVQDGVWVIQELAYVFDWGQEVEQEEAPAAQRGNARILMDDINDLRELIRDFEGPRQVRDGVWVIDF
jgi:hypothetical protein